MAAVVAVTALLLPASASSGRPVVTALVSVAGKTAPVSARVRLNLSPAAARKDFPTGLHGCYGSLTTTVAASNCVFGDKQGTKTIALIGDSHAEMWFPALERASRAAHWRLLTWTKSECPFIDSTIHIAALPVYSACTTWHASVLAQLRAQPSLDAVIVAHSSGYLSLISGPDGTTSAPSSDVPTNWGNAWASTEKTLETLTKHVIVMRDAPLPLIDVPACLAAHGSDVLSCSFPRSAAFTDGNILLAAERAHSAQNVSVVDLDPLLCPGNPCPGGVE
jgi:hypothetical protein